MAGRFPIYTDADVKLYDRMSPGDFLRAFEELADLDEPFSPYPIIHIKPRS